MSDRGDISFKGLFWIVKGYTHDYNLLEYFVCAFSSNQAINEVKKAHDTFSLSSVEKAPSEPELHKLLCSGNGYIPYSIRRDCVTINTAIRIK
jgi:hypothetical protein